MSKCLTILNLVEMCFHFFSALWVALVGKEVSSAEIYYLYISFLLKEFEYFFF